MAAALLALGTVACNKEVCKDCTTTETYNGALVEQTREERCATEDEHQDYENENSSSTVDGQGNHRLITTNCN